MISARSRTLVWVLAAVVWVALIGGCSKEAAEDQDAVSDQSDGVVVSAAISREALADFFTAHFDRGLERNPLSASYVGRETHKDQWNDVTEAFEMESIALLRDDLAQIKTFEDSALADAERLSKALFIRNGERELALDEFRRERYVIHQFRGPHTRVPSALINVHRVATVADAEAYVGRLNNVVSDRKSVV